MREFFSALAILFFSTLPAAAAEFRALDALIEKTRQVYNVPGIAVAVIVGDKIPYAKGFGVRRLGEPDSVDGNTLFHAASISKLVTATAVMQLAAKGQLDLDQDIGAYLPEFAGKRITVRQLLTHSAGFKNRIRAKGRLDRAALQPYLKKLTAQRLSYTPGDGWAYNDADYNLLGLLITKISGMPFDQYTATYLLRPAGMTTSSFYMPEVAASNIAWPHRGKRAPKPAKRHPYDVAFAPSSGLETSALELAHFIRAHLRQDETLLPSASYKVMQTPLMATEWDGIRMGLGWQVIQTEKGTILQHGGSDPGFRALVRLYLWDQSAIIILSNGETTPRWELAQEIRTAFFKD